MDVDSRTHIVVIPNPGAGHLIPMAELARHLLRHNPSLFFTFILIPTSSTASTATPSALTVLPSTAFHVIHLPPPSFPSAFSDFIDEMMSLVLQAVNQSLLPLRQALVDMTSQRHVTALIVDIFATEVIPIGSELGIKSYLFYSSSAVALSMFLHLPKTTLTIDDWALDKPVQFPGCPVFHVKDLPDPVHNRSKPYYKWFVDHCKRFHSADVIVLNSFSALEEEPIRALTTAHTGTSKPSLHVVGPLVRTSSTDNDVDNKDDPAGCLRWLDEQPLESVLYVSFGSGGTLSTDQVTELAWGLELSEQRFLWVVRSPNDSVAFGTYLSLDEKADPLGFLPRGFIDRTKGRGFVVQSWAPQVKILGHVSTGGFMTHCGWNSILEGAASGVGFIAWPLYAEQSMNAIELVDKCKVALRVEKNKDGVVGRDEVAKVVKALMEGEEGFKIRERMRLIKDEADRTMSHDGLSNATLSKLAHMCNN